MTAVMHFKLKVSTKSRQNVRIVLCVLRQTCGPSFLQKFSRFSTQSENEKKTERKTRKKKFFLLFLFFFLFLKTERPRDSAASPGRSFLEKV